MGTEKTWSRSSWLDDLNEAQRQAAEHRSGPLLVVAGAGTGKTKTVAARVAKLIDQGADPARILLLTFTRRAAQEMLRRAGRVVGEAKAKQVQGGTFHAMAYQLLRNYSEALGLGDNFVVMDQVDAQDLMHLIRTDCGLHKSKNRFPEKGTLLAIYSRCVNANEPLGQVLAERFPACLVHEVEIKRLFQEYSDRKAKRDMLDFDDLLLYWGQALELPHVGEAIAGRFQHILVDEYQDTNPLQAAVLRKLWNLMNPGREVNEPPDGSAATSCSIMVVGDDAQAVYSFRGAMVENILNFSEQFPGTTRITLEQNYRSTMPILRTANAVMHLARRSYTKNLWSERAGEQKPLLVTCADEIAQAIFVAKRILEHREEGIPFTKQAVLFRAGHNSAALEIELSRRDVPFVKWGGLKFLEAAHVKDLLAFLRVLENPRDDLSWMRILQMLEGIGPSRAREAVHILERNAGDIHALAAWNAPRAARAPLGRLVKLIAELSQPAVESCLPTQIQRILKFYLPLLEELYDNPEMRLRDLEQLEVLAQQAPSRSSFLADLTLDPPSSTSGLANSSRKDEECVTLSTIHSAKGCEWDVVYIIQATDGVIPSDRAKGEAEVEEERRLLYVGLTRARIRLFVTFPLRNFQQRQCSGDAYRVAQRTRFLPPEVLSLFDRASFCPKVPAIPKVKLPYGVSANVRARVRQLWA